MSPHIRLATPADAPAVRAIYGLSVEETATSFELLVPSVEEMARRISVALERAPWLLCVDVDVDEDQDQDVPVDEDQDQDVPVDQDQDQDTVMGYAYAVPFRARPAYSWVLESSVYVDRSHQRRGVASGLYLALMGCLREQGFHRLIAGVTLPNPPSVALHESLGFTPVGTFQDVGNKFDTWHSVGFWELELQPLPSAPTLPLTVAEASERDGFRAALEAGAQGIRQAD